MVLDDFGPVVSLRKSNYKVPIAVVALILATICLFVSITNFLYPYDYDEETPIASEYYVSYQVSVYGPMFEGDVVEINYEVIGGENIHFFIFDKSNLGRWATGETFAPLYESTGSKDDIEYTLIKNGDIYIVFSNTNTHTINLQVSIQDMALIFYGQYLYLFLGVSFGAVGILALTGNSKDSDQDTFPNSDQYPPLPPD